jgi:hypothetical protein
MSNPNLSVRAGPVADEIFCRAIDKNLEHLQTFRADFALLLQMQTVLVASLRDQSVSTCGSSASFGQCPTFRAFKALPEFRNQGCGEIAFTRKWVKQESALGGSYILSSSERRASETIAWHTKNAFTKSALWNTSTRTVLLKYFFVWISSAHANYR